MKVLAFLYNICLINIITEFYGRKITITNDNFPIQELKKEKEKKNERKKERKRSRKENIFTLENRIMSTESMQLIFYIPRNYSDNFATCWE